jgi:hypothetical protein
MGYRVISADDHIDMARLPKDFWQGDRARDAQADPLRPRAAPVRPLNATARGKERRP